MADIDRVSEAPEERKPKKNLERVEKELTSVDPKLFDGIPREKKQRIVQSIAILKTHIGPLPDPDTLEQYSAIIDNGAERIMVMAEKQQDHRISLEKRVVWNQIIQSYLGQVFAFFIGLAALGAATYCIINGQPWAGGIIGVGGIVGLVKAFIEGRSTQKRDLEEKRPKR